jgi:pimeloyl-ACP methyl ester carboxylesterase
MARLRQPSWKRPAKIGALVSLVAAGLGGAAWISHRQAREAERRHPPLGRFVTVKGVRLHYIERGRGPVVVFLHGNGAMVDDFIISGVFGLAAENHRAIVFDRPGFGHSVRPSDRRWTATAQAALLPEMFKLLGIDRAIVVGHSWGTLVALAFALDHPHLVSGLLLASGYYFPTPRTDVVLASPQATPLVGPVISHTVAPFIAEAVAPKVIAKMFSPQGVSPRFSAQFPLGLALRPSQLQALSEDTSHMVAAAEALCLRYRTLFPPTVIMAGDADEVVSYRQAQRLHGEVAGSRLDILRGGCHMIHHIDPKRFMRGIEAAAEQSIAARA